MTEAPRLVARYYDRWSDGLYTRMARVLEATAREHCPGWEIDIRSMRAPSLTGGTGHSGHLANTRKLGEWRALVHERPDGARLALLDADTWIVRPIADIWDRPFDLAYTVREGWAIPFNLGVLFVRVTDRVRAFFDRWVAENAAMVHQVAERRAWRQRYGGVNQAAFAALLEQGALEGLDVRTLPCQEWNCEDSAWARFDPAVTRIVHLKSDARAMAIRRLVVTPELQPVVTAWRQLDRAINGRQRRDA